MPQETCWTLIADAATGKPEARETFAERYLPIARAYLGARWKHTPLIAEMEDAAQEVFVDCFREGGALERADPLAAGGFRAFLFGVIQRTAQKFEGRRARACRERGEDASALERIHDDETSLSRILDREWASAIVHQAGALHQKRARALGEDHLRRVEILRLRYGEGLPIREIAARWNEDPELMHREGSRAREEFREALREVVSEHESCSLEKLERECDRLLRLLA